MRVKFGVDELEREYGENGDSLNTTRKVLQVVPHPLFDVFTLEYDIGLLRLETPISFDERVSSVCVNGDDEEWKREEKSEEKREERSEEWSEEGRSEEERSEEKNEKRSRKKVERKNEKWKEERYTRRRERRGRRSVDKGVKRKWKDKVCFIAGFGLNGESRLK